MDKFIKEYKIISEVSRESDRIADFFGIYSNLQQIIIFSEFAENGSVKDRLTEEGLPEGIAIKYFYQAAEGLAFLHSQQIPIIHKDVKGMLSKSLKQNYDLLFSNIFKLLRFSGKSSSDSFGQRETR